MVTYTKRQYLADVAANHMAACDLRVEIENYQNRLEAGEPVDTLSEAWNAAYDREWALSEERADIERRWSRRHWTGADYATHELVAANID